jgi:hypothetical protein
MMHDAGDHGAPTSNTLPSVCPPWRHDFTDRALSEAVSGDRKLHHASGPHHARPGRPSFDGMIDIPGKLDREDDASVRFHHMLGLGRCAALRLVSACCRKVTDSRNPIQGHGPHGANCGIAQQETPVIP